MKKLLWQQIPSPLITRLLIKYGKTFNGIVLDLEHGCFNNETIQQCILTTKDMGVDSYIRIRHIDPTIIQMSLDSGLDGIILSTVENASDFIHLEYLC